MKKRLIIILFAAVALTGQAQIQMQWGEAYFSAEELPNAAVWLPAPPDTLGPHFAYDITQYIWGKSMRDTERGKDAVDHDVVKAEDMAVYFSKPFGMTISKEATPAIFKLVERSIITFRLSVVKPKEAYQRRRPFARFNESTPLPQHEKREFNSGSYPSGHAIRSFGLALVLSEINPECQDSLLKLGYEWGLSRVIVGYHWQSDVDASYLMAAGVFARLHTSPLYMADLAVAREEFLRLSGQSKEK